MVRHIKTEECVLRYLVWRTRLSRKVGTTVPTPLSFITVIIAHELIIIQHVQHSSFGYIYDDKRYGRTFNLHRWTSGDLIQVSPFNTELDGRNSLKIADKRKTSISIFAHWSHCPMWAFLDSWKTFRLYKKRKKLVIAAPEIHNKISLDIVRKFNVRWSTMVCLVCFIKIPSVGHRKVSVNSRKPWNSVQDWSLSNHVTEDFNFVFGNCTVG